MVLHRKKAVDQMMRIVLPALAAVVILISPALAQNPPTFDPINDTLILEGQPIVWFPIAHDPDPEDSLLMYIEPPTSDPVYKGYLLFEKFDDSTWNFQFEPFYDLIDTDTVDFPVIFYVTDYTDTVSMPVTITVVNNNPKPILDPIGDHLIVEGVLFSKLITASDPDGSFPILTTSTLPANATFIDSLNGRGLFTFTPDETQYGDSSLDHTVIFYASDEDSSANETVTITVVGPNLAPFLGLIGPQSKTEGDTLILTITSTDPNGTYPELTMSSPWPNVTFTPSDTGDAIFQFIPTFVQSGIDTVTFYADDGEFSDTLEVEIEIADAGNQPPRFDSLATVTYPEGEDSICIVPLEVLITASDPEGGPVQFLWMDTLINSAFDVSPYARDTGLFTFCPTCDMGGSYQVKFKVVDDSIAEPSGGEDSIFLFLEITEVNFPPELLVLPPGGQAVYEGERLRIEWEVSGEEGENLMVDIFPPADSAVFKGKMTSMDSVNYGYLDFAPDYNFIQGLNDTVITIKFTTADACHTVVEERVISVFNVNPDANDPGEADTLTLVGAAWNDSIPGFSLTTRIWNDSAVAAGMTGFRWFDPWLQCDTVIFSPRLDSAEYKQVYIYNDSLLFLATFIFFDSLSLAPGEGEYFTAYFKYDPDSVDIDTIPYIQYDTAKVGSSGEFFFDKRLRAKSYKDASDDDMMLSIASPFTYKPLVKLGEVRSAADRVRVDLYDVNAGIALGRGSVLYARDTLDEPRPYEIRLQLENRKRLSGLSLDFMMGAENEDITWIYQDPIMTAVPASRMHPDSSIWSVSSGLQISGSTMDGLAVDSLRISGEADPASGGLPPGLLEYMITIPFTIQDFTGDQAVLFFDTGAADSPGTWLFTDTSGQLSSPAFDGGLNFPLAYNTFAVTNRVRLEVFDVDEGLALDENSALYARDSLDELKQYEIRFMLENTKQLADMSLDFLIYAENEDVVWTYQDTIFRIDSSSRMYPDTVVWPLSAGLQMTGHSLDGAAADSIRFYASGGPDSTGLPPGPLERMITIPFTIQDVTSQQAMLCFDTGIVEFPGTWQFTDTSGQVASPVFRGGICLPVFYNPIVDVDDDAEPVPGTYSLSQNYPNPFNPSTTIRFSLGRREKVGILVYNILGQVVTTLTDQYYNAGVHTVIWDGKDKRGRQAATGIYLYHLKSESFTDTRKMILLR
jgi:hypothetical protein